MKHIYVKVKRWDGSTRTESQIKRKVISEHETYVIAECMLDGEKIVQAYREEQYQETPYLISFE
jgi:hypothetical protein